jgi:hypothetical protein
VTPMPIRLIRAAGSHAEVGAQIGAAMADAVRRAVGEPIDSAVVDAYRAVTLEHLPWTVEELEAVGEAAGVGAIRKRNGGVLPVDLARESASPTLWRRSGCHPRPIASPSGEQGTRSSRETGGRAQLQERLPRLRCPRLQCHQ